MMGCIESIPEKNPIFALNRCYKKLEEYSKSVEAMRSVGVNISISGSPVATVSGDQTTKKS